MTQSRGLSWLALVSLFAACGGDAGGAANGPSGPVPLEGLAAPLAAAICDYFSRCLPYDGFSQFPGGCVAYELPRIEHGTVPNLQELVRTGRLKYDAEHMSACLRAYYSVSCGATESDVPDCQAALDGTVPSGGACSSNQECKGDTVCTLDVSCPGVCTPRVGASEACGDESDCRGGLTCVNSVCTPDATLGQPCGGGSAPNCAGTLVCMGGITSPGQCAVPVSVGEGETCNAFGGLLCDAGLVCTLRRDPATGLSLSRCEKRASSGAPCSLANLNQCPDGEYCPITTAEVAQGVATNCRAIGAVGDACVSSAAACGPTAICATDGRCQALKNAGQACVSATECYTGRCTAGTCALDVSCE